MPRLFANYVSVELDGTVYPFLEHTLHLIIEPGKSVERLLKGKEVIEHWLRLVVPALAGHNDANTRRIDEGKCSRDPALDRFQRHIIHIVRDQGLIGILRRHCEFRKA